MTAGTLKRLRRHQAEAVDAATQALKHLSRVTIIAATGTGKTIIAMRIAEHFTPSGHVLVLVPTLDLLSQTAAHWAHDSPLTNMVGVCSLDSTHNVAVDKRMKTLTTDARVLAETVASHTGPTVVFGTYSSLKVIEQAHRRHDLPQWSIAVVDEAHRTTGDPGKEWAAIHKDGSIPARRRLYMTATPRTWNPPEPRKNKNDKKSDKEHPPTATDNQAQPEPAPTTSPTSMDDASIYGPTVYQLTLADAIDQGILADYRIVVPVIDDEELQGVLRTKGPTPTWTACACQPCKSACCARWPNTAYAESSASTAASPTPNTSPGPCPTP
ncbi:hypothetical protein B4N89_46290 [Embleya scabrispora]|uniref:Helicase ATP-binding domain-containing protein n=1 Tax=Embleya scabrispora TaxID=159449 RepID=A0A1T3NIP8_9ACTN|nr:DEAD/DEAH box helicase family protein [Embleya scabrispora]OPC76461.1 hypothetical protein B4N89_46290 [Embleya scabrispora]